MTVQVIACGSPKADANGELKCPCCEQTFKPTEDQMLAFCWMCEGGDNPDCAHCRKEGVIFTVFSDPNPATAHAIREPGIDGQYRSACGTVTVGLDNMTGWMAPGTKFCLTCIPESADWDIRE